MIILCYFAILEQKGLGFAKAQITNELGGILIKNWSVFLPATVINIAFCPPELRVLFLNCAPSKRTLGFHMRNVTCFALSCTIAGVFFGWVVYLSLFLNDGSESEAA